MNDHSPASIPAGAPQLSAAVPAGRPSATVAICAYTERRWDVLQEAITAVMAQLGNEDELIVVIDHAPELEALVQLTFPELTILANAHKKGLSGARNTAVEAARRDAIVFLDDDAVPEPGWLETLLAPCRDEAVIGVGGYVRPRWPGEEPWWLPPEFLWVVGCSYAGLPGRLETIRNPIGASMAFRREVFTRTGLFSEALGRVGTVPVGCEETELSLRVHAAFPDHRIVHEPASSVLHQVTPERATFSYFRRRCWSEGASKAIVTHYSGQRGALSTERRYVLVTVSRGLLREVRHVARGDLGGLARALALLAGTGVTAISYLTHLRSAAPAG